MNTLYFVNSDGQYIGGFSENNPAIPQDAIEVPNPPSDAISEKWNFNTQKWAQDTETKKQVLKNQLIATRKTYLNSTDWYICREADEPNSYPAEIKAKRIQARQEINDIEAATTLTALNQFNINFE